MERTARLSRPVIGTLAPANQPHLDRAYAFSSVGAYLYAAAGATISRTLPCDDDDAELTASPIRRESFHSGSTIATNLCLSPPSRRSTFDRVYLKRTKWGLIIISARFLSFSIMRFVSSGEARTPRSIGDEGKAGVKAKTKGSNKRREAASIPYRLFMGDIFSRSFSRRPCFERRKKNFPFPFSPHAAPKEFIVVEYFSLRIRHLDATLF